MLYVACMFGISIFFWLVSNSSFRHYDSLVCCRLPHVTDVLLTALVSHSNIYHWLRRHISTVFFSESSSEIAASLQNTAGIQPLLWYIFSNSSSGWWWWQLGAESAVTARRAAIDITHRTHCDGRRCRVHSLTQHHTARRGHNGAGAVTQASTVAADAGAIHPYSPVR